MIKVEKVYKEGRSSKFEVLDYRNQILITSKVSPMAFNGLRLEYALDGSLNYIAWKDHMERY